jgi:hypothetical protein
MQNPNHYSLKSLAFIAFLSFSSVAVAQDAASKKVLRETPQEIQKSQSTSMSAELVPSTRNKQNTAKPETIVKPATTQSSGNKEKKKAVKK